MIYNFTIPTIEDNVDFTKILLKPVSAEWMKELTEYNEARKKFKAVLNEAYLKNKSFGELFSTYKETVENYLNVNVDLMRLMCKTETSTIELKWKTFLTKTRPDFTTKGGNEENMAIELIMVRYCWAFAYYSEAEQFVSKIREKVSTTFKSNSATTEDHEEYIRKTLKLYMTGWEKLRKLYNVIHLVSKSIVLDNCDFVEGKGKILDVVKGILEVNANSIFLELLRLKKDYEKIARVAYANVLRLKQARFLLEANKNEIREDLLYFIEVATKFYRAYGMWALVNHHEYLIKREDYSKKNFSRLSQEVWSMADHTLALCDEIKKIKSTSANIVYCQTYVSLFEPTCVNSYQLYKQIHQGSDKLDGEKCLAEIGDEDYLETMYSKKKPTE